MWLMVMVIAATVIVIELFLEPISPFKLSVCAIALLVIGIALFKRAKNGRHDRT